MGQARAMALRLGLLALLLGAAFPSAAQSTTATEEWIAELVRSRAAKQSPPVLSTRYPDVTSASAYEIQRGYVARLLKAESVTGYKAAATSTGAQAMLKTNGPVSGVLFESGRREPGAAIELAGMGQPVVELEFGFVFKERVTTAPADGAALLSKVGAVVPVVELPDTAFRDKPSMTAIDLAAANAAAGLYIVGEPLDAIPSFRKLDALAVMLKRGDSDMSAGRGADAMGSQARALAWLVESVTAQGRAIEKGDMLITGALGKIVPLEPGDYLADFGDLGVVRFSAR